MTTKDMHDDPFVQLVIDEAYGRAPDGTSDQLAQNLHKWKATLVDLVADSMQQLTNLNRDWQEYQAERRDPDEYGRMRAEVSDKRGRIGHFRQKIERRLRQIGLMIREQGQQQHREQRSARWRALCLWVLSDYDDTEWASLAESVPEDLADTLTFARRLHDEQLQTAAGEA